MTVLCRDILQLASLKKAELIGGANGLNRVVRWIPIQAKNIVNTIRTPSQKDLAGILGRSFGE